MIGLDSLRELFDQQFGRPARWWAAAPGRVNLIGEHTDYNGGFVMPVAIEQRVLIAAAPRNDRLFDMYSQQFDQSCCVDLSAPLEPHFEAPWANYILAVSEQFLMRGEQVPGLDMAIAGSVPVGAGLSSSAALEVATAWLLNHLTNAGLSRREVALLAQAAEHSRFVGVKCGIMDQFASALSECGHALLIDCHSLDYELVPFDAESAEILIIDSTTRRGLVESEYNRRRQECEKGLELMRELARKDFQTIRHIPMEVFTRFEAQTPEPIRRRLRHNLEENARVLEFAACLRLGDIAGAGRLLYASHASLRDNFEVSTPILDAIVEAAASAPGVQGCRLTGAGFGGCCVALTTAGTARAAADHINAACREQQNVKPEFYVTAPASGAEFESLV